ncbi:MAG: heavy metal-binding domain-containing protein [Burkholderiaceae bacterium]
MQYLQYFDLIVPLVLLLIGYGFGSWVERRHYRSIVKRESTLKSVLLFESKLIPENLAARGGHLVCGDVVISVDYFKRFVAGLRKLFGGRLKSYESLLDRGRREAILRMKQQAADLGATMVFNVRFETASISKGGGNAVGSIEVFAFGSAIIPGKLVTDR